MMRYQKIGSSLKLRSSLRALLPLAAVAALGVCVPQPGQAATYSYGSSARTVNAGVVFLGHAQDTAPDPAPYLFYTLNQRPDVKPFGWNIVNPMAPRTATQAITTRWSAYSNGQILKPSMAAYWEVPLDDTSSDQLRHYDVLYLPLQSGQNISPAENEKLRRFVDYGGSLLVEYYGGSGSSSRVQNFFFASLNVSSAPGPLDLPPVGSLYLRSPLMLEPYAFDRTDFSTLGFPALSAQTFSLTPNQIDYWGKALVGPTGTAIYAGQDGAGVMVASGIGIGPALSPSGAYFAQNAPAPELVAQAPTSDLKFLANVISYVDSHPNAHKNSRQNGSAADLASFAPAWTAPVAAGATPPPPPGGAAIWGKYVFVTDAYGVLRAFDAIPGEDLTGSGKADDGKTDLSLPAPNNTSYDEIWEANIGPNGKPASAPTVFSFRGSTYVMVADNTGKVTYYDIVTGGLSGTAPNSGGGGAFPPGSSVPAPTYYEGRIYQGQANGQLYVYDLHTGSPAPSASIGAMFALNPAANGIGGPSIEAVTDAPAVGTIADGDVTNDIVALVPTSQNLYTVFLGARADLLLPNPRTGTPTGYTINKGRLGQLNTNLVPDPNAIVDPNSPTPGPLAYTLDGLNSLSYIGPGMTDFSGGTGASYYASYDAAFAQVPSGKTLTLNSISAFSYGTALNGGATQPAVVSSPAGDRSGNFYYTVNTPDNQSYLIGLLPNVQSRGVHLTFRFRMPRGDGQADDPDGINWANLNGYRFVGAPVVDSSGRVYASATNGTNATVLCFDSTQAVYASAPGYDFSQVSITQPDEGAGASAANTILAGGTINNIPNVGATEFGQYLAGDGRVTFFNFGRATSQPRQIAGNLSEPQPVSVQPNANAANEAAGAANTTSSYVMPLHTNLVWYAEPFPITGTVTGVSKVGDTVLLADSGTPAPNVQSNRLYKINAAFAVGTGKILPTITTPTVPNVALSVTTLDTPVGNVLAAPSASSNVMVLNGTSGISAFTRQLTLIADNNRILETDSDGQAVWAADATVGDGGAKVDFSHPAGLSVAAPNDYLVADTGNNRCVRFDRGGRVLWELTNFSDPNHLLTAGSPLALSAPTSAQILRRGLSVSYLVADTGNNRILEVTDIYNANGTLAAYHVLTAATNTFDQQGRRYRYTSASYFPTAAPVSILALVTNTRIAPLAAGNVLGPVSGDAPGGSIVQLVYNPSALTANTNGITGFDNVFTSITANAFAGATQPTVLQVRTPRFLSVYNPPSGTIPSFLYADANGAFDLTPTLIPSLKLIANAGSLQFATVDYQLMSTTVNSVTTALPNNLGQPVAILGQAVGRTITPFVPTCIQRLDSGGSNPRYLITQTAGQSELGTPPQVFPGTPPTVGPTSFGGEIFEIDYSQIAVAPFYTRQISGYGLGPLSRPGLTGPLTQPTTALRQ